MTNKKTDIVAAIILNEKGEVLLQKKDFDYHWFPGYWGFFGGEIESNEMPRDALKRELYEELRCEVNNLEFFKKYSYRDSCQKGMRQGNMHIYVCKLKGNISNLSLNEGAGFAFFSKNENLPKPMISHNHEALEEYLNRSF
jgi:8-oxo-dGTP diphosphatase